MGRCMAAEPGKVWNRSAVFRTGVILGTCILLAGAGCAERIYQAAELPAELLAPPAQNLHTIDLSRLATYAVSSELIDRGDVLDVSIVTDFGNLSTTTAPVRVGEDGTANVPVVGKVPLAGLELEGAEHAIEAACVYRGVFVNPHVTVTMNRQRKNTVTVIGAVNEPGVYPLARGSSSLLAALVAAGGLSKEAGPDVEIRHPARRQGMPDLLPGQPPRVAGEAPAALTSYAEVPSMPARTVRINLVSAAMEGNGGRNLDDGDVVMVTKRVPKPIHVIGLVHKPGQYELPVNQDLRVLDALAMAGGRTSQLADKVWVIRQLPEQSEPSRIAVSVRNAKASGNANMRLASGDVVSVEETLTTFVLDAVGRFVRVGLSSSIPLF